MQKLNELNPQRVFYYFKELTKIPHGSGNQKAIADYCVDFAEKHGLKVVRDAADNVVIYKSAARGYEAAEPLILQGHLDMVCQQQEGLGFNFETDALNLLVKGDFLTADGTTLGADNGIAVAMVLAILERDDLPHPALEAVFTTDEEIGMVGAMQLDFSLLSSKKMINLDAEEDDTLTVSCAGGSDLTVTVPLPRKTKHGTLVTLTLSGLKGGHSGVEIHRGRVNADLLVGRVLNALSKQTAFSLVSANGGDKGNAIPNRCVVEFCVEDAAAFCAAAETVLQTIAEEIAAREPQFTYNLAVGGTENLAVFSEETAPHILYVLCCAPNGVQEMSAEIEGLVETSLNLGVLETRETELFLQFSLRSNKRSALLALEEKMKTFLTCLPEAAIDAFGHYPPWEFKTDSPLREAFCDCYQKLRGENCKVEAIHAGLECGVFAAGIEGLDCISFGPSLYDVHTTNEKMSISSAQKTFELLLMLLENCK